MNNNEISDEDSEPIIPDYPVVTAGNIGLAIPYLYPFVEDDMAFQVASAIHLITKGSAEGKEHYSKWRLKHKDSLSQDQIDQEWDRAPCNLTENASSVIIGLLEEYEFDWLDICASHGLKFEVCEPNKVVSETNNHNLSASQETILIQYSMADMLPILEAEALDECFVLFGLALLGQWTVVYAKNNSGKTLLVLFLLIQSIKAKRINPANLYYLNLDDSHKGLTQKLQIAEQYGFHILCVGYKDFKARMFISLIEEMIVSNQAKGVIIVIDTLKKLVDLMDKKKSSILGEVLRRFILKGGTIVALAHTNKALGADGLPVYSGTTDILDDCDAGFIMHIVSNDEDNLIRVVELINIKRRGNNVYKAAYQYSIKHDQSYIELLNSVKPVSNEELETATQAESLKSDRSVIEAITTCINEGFTAKMKLRDEVSSRTGQSKRSVTEIIDKYTGSDSSQHYWNFRVQDRGAKIFYLLEATGND